ncbi:hypothetical protein AAMO2058_000621100 [Amorphochlora amoebiformis]
MASCGWCLFPKPRDDDMYPVKIVDSPDKECYPVEAHLFIQEERIAILDKLEPIEIWSYTEINRYGCKGLGIFILETTRALKERKEANYVFQFQTPEAKNILVKIRANMTRLSEASEAALEALKNANRKARQTRALRRNLQKIRDGEARGDRPAGADAAAKEKELRSMSPGPIDNKGEAPEKKLLPAESKEEAGKKEIKESIHEEADTHAETLP